MIDNDERRIIEEEIARLERLWQDAQERYGYTGSRTTERTMHRYDTLIRALKRSLNDMVKEVSGAWLIGKKC